MTIAILLFYTSIQFKSAFHHYLFFPSLFTQCISNLNPSSRLFVCKNTKKATTTNCNYTQSWLGLISSSSHHSPLSFWSAVPFGFSLPPLLRIRCEKPRWLVFLFVLPWFGIGRAGSVHCFLFWRYRVFRDSVRALESCRIVNLYLERPVCLWRRRK